MDKRTIPEIRARLHEIANNIGGAHGEELHQLADETVRSSPSRKKAPVTHRPLTEVQRAQVRRYARNHPRVHIQDIAVRFHTNIGRVSEALRG